MARISVTADHLETRREGWGLDGQLFPDQVLDYLAATIRYDFGYSFKFRARHVADLI
ncbi:hypothetical protein [Mesorhizobium sp.]|uniref:hypothetical protein n=1 Tax=Mesorhizobium sp. TaxID=1871066 RepID=UPI0025EEC841|nr:hypothetical protein [Mesorhizobium sp.]